MPKTLDQTENVPQPQPTYSQDVPQPHQSTPIPMCIFVLQIFAWLDLIGGAVGGVAWLLAQPSGISRQIAVIVGFALILEGILGCALLLVAAGIARDIFLTRLAITRPAG